VESLKDKNHSTELLTPKITVALNGIRQRNKAHTKLWCYDSMMANWADALIKVTHVLSCYQVCLGIQIPERKLSRIVWNNNRFQIWNGILWSTTRQTIKLSWLIKTTCPNSCGQQSWPADTTQEVFPTLNNTWNKQRNFSNPPIRSHRLCRWKNGEA